MKPLHRSQCKKMMAGRRTISRETYFTRSEYPSMYWSILYFEMFIRGRGWRSTAQQPCSHIWLRFQSFTLKIVLSWLLKSKLRLSRTDGRISQARFWDKMRPSLEPLWLHSLYMQLGWCVDWVWKSYKRWHMRRRVITSGFFYLNSFSTPPRRARPSKHPQSRCDAAVSPRHPCHSENWHLSSNSCCQNIYQHDIVMRS